MRKATLKKSLEFGLFLITFLFLVWLIGTKLSELPSLPNEPPLEQFRIRTKGFSIIVPAGWDAVVVTDPVKIRASNNKSTIVAQELGNNRPNTFVPNGPNVSGPTEILFQHKKALFVKSHIQKESTWDDPALTVSQFDLYFSRNGVWYRLTFATNEFYSDMPPSVMPYFKSFSVSVE